MNHFLKCMAVALLLGVPFSRGEDAAPAKTESPTLAKTDVTAPSKAEAAEAAESEKDEPVPPYVLKNRSTFAEVEEDARAPFWPIGWIKRKTAAITQGEQAPVPVMPKVLLDEKSFKVTSILLGSGTTPSLAVINGRAYSEGEFLRVPRGSAPQPRVRVQRIIDGSVILQNAEQTVVATLTRPELQSRRPEELLLDPDR